MKTRSPSPRAFLSRRKAGFTLIELIAALVLSSVIAALLLPLISAGISGSTRPLIRLPQTYSLRSEMDAYLHLYRTDFADDLLSLSLAIEQAAGAGNNQVVYNDWVQFDAAGNEIPTPGETTNILRITLRNSQGEQLTAYFPPL